MRARQLKKLFRGEIRKISLGPGDVLLVRVPRELLDSDRRAEFRFVGRCFPDNKVLIASDESEFSVIRRVAEGLPDGATVMEKEEG
jgi:hypothetical protein